MNPRTGLSYFEDNVNPVNPQTGIPQFDDSVVGCTVTSIKPATATSPAVLNLDPPAWSASCPVGFDDYGPGEQAVIAGTMQDGEDERVCTFSTHNVSAASLVGKKILSTGLVLWRDDEPIEFVAPSGRGPWARPRVNPSPGWLLKGPRAAKPSDKFSVAFCVGLRALIYPTVEGGRGPAGATETYADGDEFGSEWAVHTFRSRAERAVDTQQAVDAEAARRCKCGNFKTSGMADGLCNGCRAKPTYGAASASGSTSARSAGTRTTAPAQSPTHTAFNGAGNRLGGGGGASGGGGDATATQAHGKKRARVEGAAAPGAEEEYAGINACPRCNMDLSDRGPLRTQRHVEKCNGA